jgi:very-short-patch-repair endonuclease/predicted CoA-binding protein
MKYKLNDFWFEFDNEKPICNLCEHEVLHIVRKKNKTKEVYIELLGRCSNVLCKSGSGELNRNDNLLAILPIDIANKKINELKINIRKNNPLCFEYWEKRGYSYEYYQNQLKQIQSKNSKKVKKRFIKTKENILKNGYLESDFKDIFKSNRQISIWVEKGYSEEEAKKIISELQKKSSANINYENRLTQTQFLYWLNKGFSEQEAKEKVSERQKTFSLEKCIEKYGEELGRKRWSDRQEVWMKNCKNTNFSKISQELFWEIYKILPVEFKEINTIKFATFDFENNIKTEKKNRNFEHTLRLKNGSYVKPDFIVLEKRKIIEFDGTYFHRKDSENKNREKKRDEKIKETGYDILHISEEKYNKNKEKTIIECLNFLQK